MTAEPPESPVTEGVRSLEVRFSAGAYLLMPMLAALRSDVLHVAGRSLVAGPAWPGLAGLRYLAGSMLWLSRMMLSGS
jgi:hypothetical protein